MIIAHNMRNLYQIFEIDLSDRQKWRSIKLDVMYYASPNPKGKFNIVFDSLAQLQLLDYAIVSIEFKEEDPDMKHYIGH
jgi:hypothetical protein